MKDADRFFETLALSEKDTVVADKVLREIPQAARVPARRRPRLPDPRPPLVDAVGRRIAAHQPRDVARVRARRHALRARRAVIGLHSRDNERLITILRKLRDQGNTVLVVEHDADMIRVADTVVDMGLGAGEQGGRVIFSGTLEQLLQEPRSLTAKYLRDELAIPVPATRRARPTSG